MNQLSLMALAKNNLAKAIYNIAINPGAMQTGEPTNSVTHQNINRPNKGIFCVTVYNSLFECTLNDCTEAVDIKIGSIVFKNDRLFFSNLKLNSSRSVQTCDTDSSALAATEA
ncbi:hypothetical protein BH11BAC3_BH11BAC3_34530 [soil metagenome]